MAVPDEMCNMPAEYTLAINFNVLKGFPERL